MNIFTKLSELFFKIAGYLLVLAVIIILSVIVKWKIDKMYIESRTGKDVEFTMIDEINKSRNQIKSYLSKEEEPINLDLLYLDEEEDKDLVQVIIVQDAKVEDIANDLISKNLMSDKNAFMSLAHNMGLENRLVPGSYDIKKGTKIKETLATLCDTKIRTYDLEISAGAAGDAVGDKLEKMGVIQSKAAFVDECNKMNAFYSFKPGKYKIETPIRVSVLIEELTK